MFLMLILKRYLPTASHLCKNNFIGFIFFYFAGGLKTRTNKVYIKFISDRSSEKTGFKVSWKAYKRKKKAVADEATKKIDERGKTLR